MKQDQKPKIGLHTVETQKRVGYTRKRIQFFTDPITRTKQSFQDECDINNIMKKYEDTGILPGMIQQNPQYGEFADVPSYHEALNTIAHAHEQFEALSAHTRDRFDNDPAKFLAFVNNPKNGEELIKMGLAERAPEGPVTRSDFQSLVKAIQPEQADPEPEARRRASSPRKQDQ